MIREKCNNSWKYLHWNSTKWGKNCPSCFQYETQNLCVIEREEKEREKERERDRERDIEREKERESERERERERE